MLQPLFEVENEYDTHVTFIIGVMLKRLKNNHPKPTSKVYIRNVSYINELYNGTFLHHVYNHNRKDYNYANTTDRIKECKGDWNKINNIITTALDNIELAKSKDYLPFNKRFVDSITFATFFEYFDINSNCTGISSNFLNFINPPKKCYEYTSNITIEKLKKSCLTNIREYGEKIVRKYFDKSQELSFWYNMEDLSRWLRCFKKTFSYEYNEFVIMCKNKNPLQDLEEYIINILNYKQGNNLIVQPIFFQLSKLGSDRLEGYFLHWLRSGIESNKFSSLKNLPKSINNYYKDESFETVNVKEKTVEKEIIDFDNIIF